MAVAPGAGRYEVLGKLAETATAELFAARTTGTSPPRLVVLKRLRRELADDPARVKQFLSLARLAHEIEHANVARVLQVGKLGGSYYCAIELVDGETVRAIIAHARANKIPIPLRVVLTLAAGAAAGLQHVHECLGGDGNPLVHGAISPTSVMVSRDGIVKLVGLARVPESGDRSYASPEQLAGRPIDQRSDLFSLGVVLWELLALEPLARDGDLAAPAPSTRRYELPRELDAIVLKLLAHAPAERQATAGELLAAIEALASKLELALSTSDLARVMRLWHGDASAGASELPPAVVVDTEDGAAEVDALLDAVRGDAAAIRTAVAAAVATPLTRRARTTVIPTGDPLGELRESFEQVRDRILANARPRKDTGRGAAAAAAAAPGDATATATAQVEPRHRPETLNPTHQYSYITTVKGKAPEPTPPMTATPPHGAPVGDGVAEARPEPASDAGTPFVRIQPKRVQIELEPPLAKVVVEPEPPLDTVIVEPEPPPAKVIVEPEPPPAKVIVDLEPARAPAMIVVEPARLPAPAPDVRDAPDAPDVRDVMDDEPSSAPPRPRWLAPVLAGAVAVAGIVVVIGMRGGKTERPAPPPPPPPQAPAIVAIDAREPIATALDAPALVPTDAAVVATVVIDAGPPDAAIDAPDVAAAPADAGAHHHHHHHHDDAAQEPVAGERTIEQLFEAGEFGKASAGCTTATLFNTPRLVDCALAACHVHDAALAKRWVNALAIADRHDVVDKCRALGVELEPPPPQAGSETVQ